MASAHSQDNSTVSRKLVLLIKEPLVLGLAISLAIHVLAYGGWKLGQRFQLIPADLIPRLLQKLQAMAVPPKEAAKKLQASQPPELMFVDVSPDQFAAEPPKNPKYYGAITTRAANPDLQLDWTSPRLTANRTRF